MLITLRNILTVKYCSSTLQIYDNLTANVEQLITLTLIYACILHGIYTKFY